MKHVVENINTEVMAKSVFSQTPPGAFPITGRENTPLLHLQGWFLMPVVTAEAVMLCMLRGTSRYQPGILSGSAYEQEQGRGAGKSPFSKLCLLQWGFPPAQLHIFWMRHLSPAYFQTEIANSSFKQIKESSRSISKACPQASRAIYFS